MQQSGTLYIGRDGHTESIAVAYVAHEHGAAVTYLGAIGTRQCDIDQLIRQMHSQATHLVFVEEASPWGYWLSRSLRKKGDDCGVGAPSLIPNKAGDRGKTDRRDAVPLARLARSGALTPVYVPNVDDAAMRELTRARADALRNLQAAQFQRTAVFLRHDIRSTGRATWGAAPWRWRAEVVCPTPARHSVCHEYVRAVNEHTARLPRLEPALQEQVNTWRLSPVVEAFQALRGVPCTEAVPPVATLGDLTRFATPRALMQFFGLIPSEYATGERRRQGAITQAGTPLPVGPSVKGPGRSALPPR
jgi:transposase